MARRYVPERGDIVWLQFDPGSGHEQSGRRPALTLSPARYNAKVGLGLFCPITSRPKGYPFEVELPSTMKKVTGVVLADQVKSLDWRARAAKRLARLPEPLVAEVLARVRVLLGED